jgi:MoxR-like ATPase
MQEVSTTIIGSLRQGLNSIVVGQSQVIDQLLVALLAGGHVLLEGVPGTAKTLLVKSLASLISSPFSRIQLTPDMLPADILGTSIYDLNTKTFHLKKGPLFTSLLLADEINRTPPKTQSALLEAMEEGQVTLDGHIEYLPDLFMVVATQNPIEFEGTYPLPEAQLDRFMLKVLVDYPSTAAEVSMLSNWQDGLYGKPGHSQLQKKNEGTCLSAGDILECRKQLAGIFVEESLLTYVAELVGRSRKLSDLQLGASPRAAIHWLACAKAHAYLNGRDYLSPDDIKAMAEPVLRHRLLLKAESELEGIGVSQVIINLLNQVPVPR